MIRLLVIIAVVAVALALMLASMPVDLASAQGGGDLIVNGTFASDLSGWTHSVSPAAWSWSSGQAFNGSASGCIYQDIEITSAIMGVYQWSIWRSDTKTWISFYDMSAGASGVQLGQLSYYHGNWGGSRFALESGHTYRMEICAGTSGSEWVDDISLTWTHDFAPCAADGWCNSDFEDAFHGWEYAGVGSSPDFRVYCSASNDYIEIPNAAGIATPLTQSIVVALPTVYEWQFPPGSDYQIESAVYDSDGNEIVDNDSTHDDDWIGSLLWSGNYDVVLRDGSSYDAIRDYFTVTRRATIPQYGSICDIEDNDLAYDDWRWTPVITTSNWYWAQGDQWCQIGGANGCLRQPFTTTITATWSITGYHNGNTRIGIKKDGVWVYYSDVSGANTGGELGAGRHTVEICDSSSSNNCVTSVELSSDHPTDCGQEQYYPDPPGGSWDIGAWIYYPLTQADEWSHYQTYSQTTWYAPTYTKYNIWRARPGASAYSIATLDITDVGVNQFGYYVTAQINVWPDVQSTTLRYEGLQTVLVAPGQRIGPQCEIGKIAPNSRLYGEYHLLLGVWYPDTDTPFNPYPYMGKRPVPGMCVPVDPGTGGLPPSGIPNYPFAVCQECQSPTTWLNFGRWIVWLECMIQNLFLCYLLEWINSIIVMQILALQHAMATGNAMMLQFNGVIGTLALIYGRLAETGTWGAEPINAGLAWLDGLAADGTNYLSGWGDYLSAEWLTLGSRLDNLNTIIIAYAGDSYINIYNEAGTNFWDVLVGMFGVLAEIWGMIRSLVEGVLIIIIQLINWLISLFNMMMGLALGMLTALADNNVTDPVVMATGVTTLDCSQSGVWAAVEGPSVGKVACYFVSGIEIINRLVVQTPLAMFPYIVMGMVALGLLYWTANEFKEILPA